MFMKMLRSELKTNKGLNTVIFVFMVIASVLVFSSSVLIYSMFVSEQYTAEVCNVSQLMYCIESRRSLIEERRSGVEDVLSGFEEIIAFDRDEMIQIDPKLIDIDGFDRTGSKSYDSKTNYLGTVPHKFNLLRDLNDEPLEVPAGCVALPVTLKNEFKAKPGDKFRITTEMGNIYELTICGYYKESAGFFYRYILSDEDYEVIAAESHYVSDMWELRLNDSLIYSEGLDLTSFSNMVEKKFEDEKHIEPRWLMMGFFTDDNVLMLVISVFVVMTSIFMILIILMTIRFTIIAALKEEEQEIGMMRAMGIESLSFRWLFASKYVFFTLMGSVAGVIGGLPAVRLLLSIFTPNNITPDSKVMLLLGIPSELAVAVIMILFAMNVMRRINRISVVDAIHGENRGERFGSSAVIFLYKRRKMPVPLYLAVSDILKRFKRYLFLIISYVLGISIVLITVNLRNSVISDRFMCYSSCYAWDFEITFTDPDDRAEMTKRCKAEGLKLYELVNHDLQREGIPAEIDIVKYNHGKLIKGDAEEFYEILFGGGHLERFTMREGRPPVLENEVMLSYYTANRYGYKVGDVVTFNLMEKTEDNMGFEYKDKQLVITGFIDALENNGGTSFAIMGTEYDDGYPLGNTEIGNIILTDDSEKDEVRRQIQELYPKAEVVWGRELAKSFIPGYDHIFAMLEYIMSGIVIFISVLMTYLYMNIFIAEEKREIALMKSMGFTDGTLRAWQMIRLLLLTAGAVVISLILYKTAAAMFIRKLFELLPLSGFSFLPEYLFNICIIPLSALAVIGLAGLLKTTVISRISVRSINEE